MKSKRSAAFLTLGFALLMGGALLLYNALSGDGSGPGPVAVENGPGSIQGAQDSRGESPSQPGGEESPFPSQGAAAGSAAQPQGDAAEEAEQPPQPAPDFSVLDQEGGTVSLSGLRGKPVVLNFWASWCGPCKSEMADFDQAYGELGGQIHFMMVNLTDGYQETVETAQAYVEGEGFSFPVYFDTESQGAIAYGVSAIPTTYFIDAQGYPVAYAMGALNSQTLRKGIDMILPQ